MGEPGFESVEFKHGAGVVIGTIDEEGCLPQSQVCDRTPRLLSDQIRHPTLRKSSLILWRYPFLPALKKTEPMPVPLQPFCRCAKNYPVVTSFWEFLIFLLV